MKKRKYVMFGLIALTSVLLPNTLNAENTLSPKYEKLYNFMTKNIDKGISNESATKTLEKILKQRNKELKDLYQQGDYIVKPEYLEWQVFATGFYSEYGKGRDNTDENAKYYSQVSGYFDANGNYIVTSGSKKGISGKTYQPLQKAKDIDLGVNIPLKQVDKNPIVLNLTPTPEINITPNNINVSIPTGVTIPQISVIDFQPLAPNLVAPTPIIVTPLNLSFPGSGNGDSTWFGQTSGNAPIKQQSMTGNSGIGTFETLFTGTNNVRLYINNTDMQGYAGGHTQMSGAAHTENAYTLSGTASFSSMLLVGGELIPISNMDLINLRLAGTNNLALFHTDSHNDYGSSIWSLNNTNVTLKGEQTILFDNQYHGSTGDSGMAFDNGIIIADNTNSYTSLYDGTTYTYNPQNRYIFVSIADGGGTSRYLYFKNEANGEIYLNGTKDTLSNFAAEDNTTYGGSYFENRGIIELNGKESMGAVFAREYSRSWIRFENTLNLNGDKSVGALFTYNFNTNASNGAGSPAAAGSTYEQATVKDSVFNITIGEKSNPINADSNDTNIIGNTSDLVEEATALYFNNASATRSDYKIMHAQLDALEFSKKATLISLIKGKVILDGTDTNNRLKIDGGTSKTGINNIAIYAGSTSSLPATAESELENYIPLTITNSDLSTGIFAEKRAIIQNDGDITIQGSNGIKGLILDTFSQAVVNGNINLTSGGVYTDISNNKTGSVIIGSLGNSSVTTVGSVVADVKGKESIAFYADNNSTIDIQNTSSNIKGDDGAFVFTSTNGGTIKYGGLSLEAGQKSLLFYLDNTSNIEITTAGTTAKIVGSTNSSDRGTAFYYKSPTAYGSFNNTDISAYFSNRYNTTLTNLTLNMDEGSRLFIADNVAMNLTSTNLSLGGITGSPNINMLGTSFKTFMLYQSDLTIDKAVNLDLIADDYNNLEMITSKITNNGYSIIGTTSGQSAMAQENGLDMFGFNLPRNTVTLINDAGNIALSGSNSVGMYSSYGELKNINSGLINMQGNNSIGIYGANGTLIDNQATISVSNNGVGIFAEGYKQGVAQSFGDGKIDITNSGLIETISSTEAIGIYADNNTLGTRADAIINLSTGTIDVSNSEKGVGVYVNNGTLTDTASTITVGKDGLAIYAKDSDINLAGSTTINLNGDNATGVYLDSTSTVNPAANLTFNVNGKNTVLFNLNFSTPTIINAGFTVNTVAPGSNYLGGNITNGHIKYTGNAVLNSNSILFNAVSSEIIVDASASITAVPGAINVAGMIVDGHSPSGAWISAIGFDGENQGTISLGDQSIGIFGKNGAWTLNTGIISIGNESVGLKSDSITGRVYNEGIINIGYKSQGMYLKNGDYTPGQPDIFNDATGQIISSSNEAVGMFADDVDITQNDGLISLTGDQSVGIYIAGLNPEDTINNGTIILGNSSSINSPSIGIYSTTAGENITNTGSISVGSKSIGIYADSSLITQNGSLSIGNEGIGVYSIGGTVNLNTSSSLNFGTKDVVGIYGVGSTINNNTNHTVGNDNYGFILEGGSFNNVLGTNSTLGTNSVFLYSTQASNVTNDGDIILSGDDNIAFYTAADPVTGVGGANISNTGNIYGTTGKNNIGIYNYGGSVTNTGNISVGDSGLVLITQSNGDIVVDVANSKYAVGIYGESSTIINSNNISAGYGGVGIVANKGSAVNTGTIVTTGDFSMGMYTEEGVVTNAAGGTITASGDNTIGMAGKGTGSHLINNGTINVTGKGAIAMYGNYDTVITNTGVINISGTGASAFVSPNALDSRHSISGLINGAAGNNSYIHQSGGVHTLPTLVNAGIIKTNGVLALDGIQILIQPNPNTITASTDPDYDFELSGTSLIADHITTSVPIVILPGFADGTIADVYKLSGLIQASSGQYDFLSGSLLWEATPDQTSTGADIYMSRKSFDEFTSGLWFDDFGKALDAQFLNARGNDKATEIYNNTGYITNEADFRHVMASLAGNVYANINQREKDIADTFEDSLHILQNSTNNTKENVKISVIGGKGKNKEETDGVVGYDYTTTGVLALREVERTYKHTFGYSLGYLHTGFEFKDGNESEEWVDTIQLGVHNKYTTNGWQVRNDFTGRASIHNVDRNIDWPNPVGRSEMDGHYETYSLTSDNILGKEFNLGKNSSIMPYGGVKAMYVTRPSFEEKGLEALKVEGNDAWSVKPRAGVELNTSVPLGQSTWKVKGTLDLSYDYELANLNEREKAKLINVEDGYHNLSKPEKEKGTFRTKASVGVEVTDRYGIFLTGEYSVGEHKEDDYRAGVNLKAVF